MTYKNTISFVWVNDMERAKDFYTKVLGFTEAFGSRGWIELAIPGVHNGYVALNQWGRDEPAPKNQFITLGVQDLREFINRLKGHNVEFKGDITDFYEEGIRMIKFFDLDENVITAAEVVR